MNALSGATVLSGVVEAAGSIETTVNQITLVGLDPHFVPSTNKQYVDERNLS